MRRRARRAMAAAGITAMVVPLSVALGAGEASAATCTRSTGPYQKQVEKFLGLRVDGRQSAGDCTAIRAFQTKHLIKPNIGYAGPITWGVMTLITKQKPALAAKNPNAAGKCPTNKGRIACVDLTLQISWIQDGSKLKYGPVPVRTGRNGAETRTGSKKIYYRVRNHWSTIYRVWMPYSQFFDGGIAFHQVDKSMYAPPGSGGCVNMRKTDAIAYWNLLKKGDDVYVYGRKPGT